MQKILRTCVFVLFAIMPCSIGFANDTVKLNLKGHISKSCSIYNVSDVIDLSKNRSQIVNFDFYCNSPFDISVSSLHGGLKNGWYLAEYQYSVDIPKAGVSIDGNSKQSAHENKIVSIDKVPFKSKGKIQVSLLNDLSNAGTYQEVLQINLYPRQLL